MIHGYTMDALEFDSGSETWSLRSDYDHTQHRVEFNFNDDDAYLDGDWDNGEVGDDANQSATVNDTSGNQIASGQVYAENYYRIEGPDGEVIYLHVIEIDGDAVGYVTTSALSVGVSYPQTGRGNVFVDEEEEEEEEDDEEDNEDTRAQYSELDDVPCFCQGTNLMTDEGKMAVDWIRAGDRVLTKDNGFQTVLWTGRTVVSADKMKTSPSLRPIRIAAHSMGENSPALDLLLSAEHRILLGSPQIELLFGCNEVFAPSKFIINDNDIAQTLPDHNISYYHILFQNHEIVMAEGLWVESFFTGDMAMASLSAKMQAQIRGLLGATADTMKTARKCLKAWEAALLPRYGTAKEQRAKTAA